MLQRDSFPYEYVFIEPSYNVFHDFVGNSCQHPCSDVRAGEALIHELYLALRASPIWERSLFIIVWDEHGGFGIRQLTNRDAAARSVLPLLSLDEARPALTNLPRPPALTPARVGSALAAARPDAEPDGLVLSMVQTAMRKDLQTSPNRRTAITTRAANIRTRQDALEYVREVEARTK